MIDIKTLEKDSQPYNYERLNNILYEKNYKARKKKFEDELQKGRLTSYEVQYLPTFEEDYKLIRQFSEYKSRVDLLLYDLYLFPLIDPTREIFQLLYQKDPKELIINVNKLNYTYTGYDRPEATHCFESDGILVFTKDINFGMRLRYTVDFDNKIVYPLFCIGHNPEERERLRNMSLTYLSTETNTKLFSEGTMSAKEQWLKEHPLPKVLQDYKMPIFLKDNEVSPLTNRQKELMKKAFQYQYKRKPILKEKSFPTKQEFESLGIKGTFI